jgi:hypothetical protein
VVEAGAQLVVGGVFEDAATSDAASEGEEIGRGERYRGALD